MQELRLVGVQEDGGHLLLSNEAGEEFSLPVTEALRAAATRPIGRPSARAADAAEGIVTPRDIQARIRAGATAEQVAAESGVDLERVRKYEGPVLAERDWMAHLARQVEVAAPVAGHDLYRSTFGEEPALLGDMVQHRLAALGLDGSTAHWDAWRNGDGSWTISLDFSTQGIEGSGTAIGDQPPALWSFRQSSRHLNNQNRWAQVLSEIDPLDGPFGGRRLSAVGDRPFNVEEDETAAEPAAAPAPRGPRPAVEQDSQDELLDVLRARRGQRLGVDEEGDDELALMLTRDEHPSAVTPRPRLTVASAPEPDDAPGDFVGNGRNGEDSPTGSADHDARGDDDVPVADEASDLDSADDADGTDELDDARDRPEVDLEVHPDQVAREPTEDGAAADRTAGQSPGQAGQDGGDKGRAGLAGRKGSSRQTSKSKRPSVPSWDEIVFGRKND
jgi:hypothetical protein